MLARCSLVAGCLLAVALIGAEIAGCGDRTDAAPPGSPGGGFDGDAIPCAVLLDAGPALAEQGEHSLRLDGGILDCYPDGLECPLPDTDAGACDGGVKVARPYATCLGARWVGHCSKIAP